MKQKFDPIDDFTPIAIVASYPMILIASPQTTFKTLAELQGQQAAKTPMFYSSSGVGSPGPSLGRAAARRASDANLTHVPYKGGSPSVLAIIVGRGAAELRDAARRGAADPRRQGARHRASRRRSAIPRCPTCRRMAELGLKDFEVGTWSGLIAPARRARRRRASASTTPWREVVHDPVGAQAPRRRRHRDPQPCRPRSSARSCAPRTRAG